MAFWDVTRSSVRSLYEMTSSLAGTVLRPSNPAESQLFPSGMDSEEGRAVSGKRPYKKRSLKQSFSEPKLKRAKGSFGLAGKTRSDGSCIVKGNWTDSEDERLIELVHQSLEDKKNYKVAIASTRWSEIAKELPGRVGKQCRER